METTTTWCLELLHFKRIGLGFWRHYEIKNLTVNPRQHREQITLEICHLWVASYSQTVATEGEVEDFKSFEQWKSTDLAEQLRIRAATSSHSH